MKWLRPLLLFASLAASAGAWAQVRPSTPEYREACDSLMCQCGCNATISHCSMEHCHSAEPIREEIWDRLQKGESVAAIIEAFKERYGLAILSAPPTSGFHITAWVAPFLVLLIGFFITRRVLGSWKRQSDSSDATSSQVSDATRARIEKELRDLSS